MNGTLLRFRIMAYVVGCWLLLLVGVAMPLKYAAGSPTMAQIVSPIHGLFYMIYIAMTVLLARESGWRSQRTLGVLLAGTVPFLSFWMERKVLGWVRSDPTSAKEPKARQ